MIDNGASFYFHHSWMDFDRHARNPVPHVKDHVLLPQASMLDEANEFAHGILTPEVLAAIVAQVPDDWLKWTHTEETPQEIRQVYTDFLNDRLQHSSNFLNEAKNARG